MNAAKQHRYGFHQGGREELPSRVIPKALDLGHIEGITNATTWKLEKEYHTLESSAFGCQLTTCGRTWGIFALPTGGSIWTVYAQNENRTLTLDIAHNTRRFCCMANYDRTTLEAIAGTMCEAIIQFQINR